MTPVPTKIHYHKQSRELELAFADDQSFRLSSEYLRVHSPSAEVRGHGLQMPILQYGKKDVTIQNVEGAGNYALKISFNDGHDSGLYSWEYLYNLGKNHDELWQMYLDRLEKEGQTRDTSVIQLHQL
ncbi:MAG: gamma-butyrobetaine hydroxylase-like domain-containing protein [Marinomonadaceae bacterium]